MNKQIEILKNSKSYILNDLNRLVHQSFYMPSKRIAKNDIDNILTLDHTENVNQSNQVVNFTSKNLNLVPRMFQILMESEGFKDRPYIDRIEGKGNYLIGYGQQIFKDGRGGWKTDFGYFISKAQIPISKEIANEMLDQKMNLVANEIKHAIEKNTKTNRQLNPNQFSALCELGYNVGVPRLLKYKVMRYIYEGNFEASVKEFADITNGGLPGLIIRRKKDMELFNS